VRAKTKYGLRAGEDSARAGHGGGAEAWAQGIRMARKSREEETMRLPNALFDCFLFSMHSTS